MQKSRMKSKLKQIIPESPTRTRKAELLIPLANSPQTKNAIQNNSLNTSLNASPSESDATDREIVESLKETFSVIKSKSQSMNKDLLNSYKLGVAASCSNLKTVSKRQAAKRLGIRPSMVTKTLKSFCQAPDPLSWFSSEQYRKKNRKRSLSIEHQETIKEFWHNKSRPTADKCDIIRKRIGYKTYLSRPRQILEKTQTEIYNDFIVEHSEVKVSQRCFEKLRPHYVKLVTKKD